MIRVPKEIEREIIRQYKNLAHSIYIQNAMNGGKLTTFRMRMMILQVITNHILSSELEAFTTAKRITKNKITRQAKREMAKMVAPEAKECNWN